jgi:hypothetical protein
MAGYSDYHEPPDHRRVIALSLLADAAKSLMENKADKLGHMVTDFTTPCTVVAWGLIKDQVNYYIFY